MGRKRRFGGSSEMERINKIAFECHAIIGAILFAAYVIEVVKGNRTPGYLAVFSLLLLIPLVIAVITRIKDPENRQLKYIVGIGYAVFYIFVILTGSTILTFTYILPMVVVLMLYSDVGLLVIISVLSLLANVVGIVMDGSAEGWSAAYITDAEIRMAVLVLTDLFAILGSKMTAIINQQKLDRLNREKGMATNVLEQTLAASKEIITNIEQVNKNMGSLGDSVKVTRDSMEQVSEGAGDTAETVQDQLAMTEQIQKYIERVENVSDSVKSNVNAADDAIGHGQKNMDKMMHQSGQSQSAAKEVVRELSELTEHVDEMQSIVEMIEDITSETSLLSLNASIEAARAGEAGKGFAVVASEISKLADQTSTATVNITELIQNIGTALHEVVDAINTLVESNDLQNQYAKETSKDFAAISDKTDDISELSGKLSGIIMELANANSAIVDSVQNISAITEEVSAHATETFNESERNLEIVKEVGQLVESLTVQAQQLSND